MADIRLIKKDTDLSHLKKPIGWDLEVRCEPYDVYRVEGYNHTLGGRWGENCYWACPAGEKPSYENLIQFGGSAPTWGITFDEVNYTKTKWNETEIRNNGVCWITRNGEKFYNVMGRDMSYALSKAQYYLVKLLEECPLHLNERNWEEKAIGRKIWYQNQPAIIERITHDNNLWIVPDKDEGFKIPSGWDKESWSEYEGGLMTELLSPYIDWFRE